MKILLTGGLGYIGSVTCAELIKNGHEVVIVDNLSNSSIDVLQNIKKVTNVDVPFYQVDILDANALNQVFVDHKIDSVIHFAGLKAVGESCQVPLKYYQNNITGTINLLQVMAKHNVKNIIFSSSATVYDPLDAMPVDENSPLGAINPYGRTKLFIEYILKDVYASDKDWNIVILRYFNPVGADDTGLLGEKPNGIPNNLMPYITKVALGKLDCLKIFGNDYPTKDGTGVRDYIHVMDLANGHVLALKKLTQGSGLNIYNLGTGVGYSVLDMVNTFNNVNADQVKYVFAPRRDGDSAQCYANANLARKELGFETKRTLSDMCKSAYLFEKNNTK